MEKDTVSAIKETLQSDLEFIIEREKEMISRAFRVPVEYITLANKETLTKPVLHYGREKGQSAFQWEIGGLHFRKIVHVNQHTGARGIRLAHIPQKPLTGWRRFVGPESITNPEALVRLIEKETKNLEGDFSGKNEK